MILNSITGPVAASTRNPVPPNAIGSAAKNAKPPESTAPPEASGASVESESLSTEATTPSVISSLGEAFRTLQFLKNNLLLQPEVALRAQANHAPQSVAKLLA